MNIDSFIELLEKLIEYKILDKISENGDEGSTGYYLEIQAIKEELIKELIKLKY